ncbi:hypothetical protein C4579_03610 [Candidatus Microgenomates bacterium]|nr:MAG: hypothetical protein C4579_03610 [Candidatus Microgenomates bacterium]
MPKTFTKSDLNALTKFLGFKPKQRAVIAALFGLIIVAGALVFNQENNETQQVIPSVLPTHSETVSYPPAASESAQVKRVVDGDTIELTNGETVRYIGIDTPESVAPGKPVECFAQEASNKNKELVEGKIVKLEKDVSETDRYGRLLRFVYVDDIFVNEYLVKEGYAHPATFPPDVKYQEMFKQAETEARENERGLWGTTCAS